MPPHVVPIGERFGADFTCCPGSLLETHSGVSIEFAPGPTDVSGFLPGFSAADQHPQSLALVILTDVGHQLPLLVHVILTLAKVDVHWQLTI